MQVLPSYRNQSIDLQNKSVDWFLYEATLTFNALNLFRVFRTLPAIDGGTFSSYSCSQSAITCSKLTIETLEQGVKYQS